MFLLRNIKRVVELLQSPCGGLRRCVTGSDAENKWKW